MRLSCLIILALLAGLPMAARAQNSDPYTYCAFYPQGATCDKVYQRALKDSSPPAFAVKQAWLGYARYLKTPSPGLTDQDRAWLRQNGIDMPVDLDEADLAGLHNVIADPALKDATAKRNAVNNFINRALEAELYCGFNPCGAAAQSG